MRSSFYVTVLILVVGVVLVLTKLCSSPVAPAFSPAVASRPRGRSPERPCARGRTAAERCVKTQAEIRAPFESAPLKEKAAADKVRAALGKPISFSFDGTPLRDVFDFLRQIMKIDFVLEFHGKWDDEPLVYLSVKKMRAQNAIDLILLQTETAWTYHRGALYISTPESIRKVIPRVTRAYDLTSVSGSAQIRKLARMAARVVGGSADEASVEGAVDVPGEEPILPQQVSAVGTRLVARLTRNGHIRLANLLRMLAVASSGPRARVLRPAPRPDCPGRKALEKRLDAPLPTFSFDGTPLRDVLDFIRMSAEFPCLCLAGVDDEQAPITLTVKGTTVRAGLDWVASGPNRWIVHRGAVIVTSRERAGRIQCVETRLYDVRDILQGLPVDSPSPRSRGVRSKRRTLAGFLADVPSACLAALNGDVWQDYLVVAAPLGEHARLQAHLAASRGTVPVSSGRRSGKAATPGACSPQACPVGKSCKP